MAGWKQINVQLDADMMSAFQKKVDKSGWTRKAVLTELIKRYLKE